MPAPPVEAEATPKRSHRAPRRRTVTANLRCSPEWKAWLADFAAHNRRGLADTLDEALLRFARAESFRPPPRR